MKWNEPKKIIIITDVFKMMAGSEKNIISLLTFSNKDKFDFTIACFVSGELAQKMREKGDTIYELRRGRIHSPNGIKNIFSLKELIRKENASLIMAYHEASDFYGLLLSKICRVPVISNQRDMGFKKRSRHRIAYKLFGKCFDRVVAVSHAVKREIIRKGWFDEEKIDVIYNGVEMGKRVNEREMREKREKIGLKAENTIIGLIANLRKIKGIEIFIRGAALILKGHPEVEFLIIGEDMGEPGCTRKDLECLAKEIKILNRIHFLGKRSDITDLISIIDIGVVPSLSEGFSNTLLEYMASSKPVVATKVGGNVEAVLNGETGFLIPPGDAEALAKAICSLISDKERALKFGEAGRKLVEEKFSLKRMINDYESLFENVMVHN